MKIDKNLKELLSTLLVNTEPLLDKVRVENVDMKRNLIISLQRIKELREILEDADCPASSKKFRQSKLFNLIFSL